jgi:hypothetical protein
MIVGRGGVPRGRTAALGRAARDFSSWHAIGGRRKMPGVRAQSPWVQRQNTRVLAAPTTRATKATRASRAPGIIWPLWQQIAPALPHPLVVSNHPAGTSICRRIANSPIENHRTTFRLSLSRHFTHIITGSASPGPVVISAVQHATYAARIPWQAEVAVTRRVCNPRRFLPRVAHTTRPLLLRSARPPASIFCPAPAAGRHILTRCR